MRRDLRRCHLEPDLVSIRRFSPRRISWYHWLLFSEVWWFTIERKTTHAFVNWWSPYAVRNLVHILHLIVKCHLCIILSNLYIRFRIIILIWGALWSDSRCFNWNQETVSNSTLMRWYVFIHKVLLAQKRLISFWRLLVVFHCWSHFKYILIIRGRQQKISF